MEVVFYRTYTTVKFLWNSVHSALIKEIFKRLMSVIDHLLTNRIKKIQTGILFHQILQDNFCYTGNKSSEIVDTLITFKSPLFLCDNVTNEFHVKLK